MPVTINHKINDLENPMKTRTTTFRLRCQFFVMLLTLLAVTAVPALQVKAQNTGVTVVVTAANVNLRGGPGLDFNEVGAAKAGDSFDVLGRAHGSNRVWYK